MEALESPLDLTVVIPCLNEEKDILGTLETVTAALLDLPHSYEILVIDDGSTDDTAAVVEAYRDAHPELPVRLHKNPRNRGLARSYMDGAFLARGKYYKQVCGDNVEPKETLVAILSQLGKADIIIPYHQNRLPGKSAFRLWLSGSYTRLVNLITGHHIRYYNGLAVHLRYHVMRWGPYSFGFGFQAELITRLLDEGAGYLEVPVYGTHRNKTAKNSALNLKNFLSVTHTLLEMFIWRVRKGALEK